MSKYEYKVVKIMKSTVPPGEELNRLGDEGWELVCCYSPTVVGSFAGVVLFLKRLKP